VRIDERLVRIDERLGRIEEHLRPNDSNGAQP
jgi:hypothetical protein